MRLIFKGEAYASPNLEDLLSALGGASTGYTLCRRGVDHHLSGAARHLERKRTWAVVSRVHLTLLLKFTTLPKQIFAHWKTKCKTPRKRGVEITVRTGAVGDQRPLFWHSWFITLTSLIYNFNHTILIKMQPRAHLNIYYRKNRKSKRCGYFIYMFSKNPL